MSRTVHHGIWRRRCWRNGAEPRTRRGERVFRWSRNPGWFDREFNNRPSRVKTRRQLRRVMMGELEQVWPLARKPCEYYW